MQIYALWGEVQEKLRRCADRLEGPANFLEAMHMLYEEGKGRNAQCLPEMGMERWDCTDMEEFHRIMDRMPVDLGCFMEGRTRVSDPLSPAMREAMNTLPIKIAAHQKVYMHQHKNYELLYTMQGAGCLHLPGGVVSVPAGMLCLVAPDFTHDVCVEPDSELISIAFWKENMEQVLRKLLCDENIMSDFFYNSLSSAQQGYVLLELPLDREVCWTIRNIFQEGYSRKSYAKEICISYVELLFAYAVRGCARLEAKGGKQQNGVPMATVMKYIQDNFRTATLNDVAAVFHYDPDYLGKRIKTCMGQGYADLVGKLKLERAQNMLCTTALTVERVAELAGYGSASYFSRTFRAQVGVTPTEYRKGQNGKSQG